jgi:hypothetical protein
MNKDKIINKLLKQMKPIKDESVNEKNTLIDDALLKFDKLKSCKYIETSDIEKGFILRYVDFELKKVTTCLVIDIEYNTTQQYSTIKYIVVKNIYNKIWKLKPKQYLFFKIIKENKLASLLKKYLTDNIIVYTLEDLK